MNIQLAITGDVHLKKQKNSPERFRALENIFSQSHNMKIKHLVIAGDLFDSESQSYSDFDNLLNQYSDIHTYLIPGNHDAGINQHLFAAANLTVFTEPTVMEFNGKNFLFIPYTPGKSMGEAIAEKKEELKGPWVLIGHGDYLSGKKEANPYEPGTYMPLNRNDIDHYQPDKVILGHIHKFYNTGKLYYTGSPCGIDINETGRRRFLTIDTTSFVIESHLVETDHIYFSESLIVLPVTNEWEYLKEQLQKMIQKWNLNPGEKSKAIIRLKVKGYTSSIRILKQSIM